MDHGGDAHEFAPVSLVEGRQHDFLFRRFGKQCILPSAAGDLNNKPAGDKIFQNGLSDIVVNVQSSRHILDGPFFWAIVPDEQQGFQLWNGINFVQDKAIDLLAVDWLPQT